MKTIAEFAAACKHLTSDEIYVLFEDEISQELRDEIYLWSDDDSDEPCRNALNKLGMYFSVQTLAKY